VSLYCLASLHTSSNGNALSRNLSSSSAMLAYSSASRSGKREAGFRPLPSGILPWAIWSSNRFRGLLTVVLIHRSQARLSAATPSGISSSLGRRSSAAKLQRMADKLRAAGWTVEPPSAQSARGLPEDRPKGRSSSTFGPATRERGLSPADMAKKSP